jgi:NAD(P)-dependent dehydrogenase (short-subunit alcohol dehydrogenase family)
VSDKKTVIVSGATYGIGRGIVIDLARRGYAVVGFGLDGRQPGSAAANGIQGTKDALEAEGLSADILEADVSKADAVAGVVAHALGKGGVIHGAVNNAAIRPSGSVLDTDEALFDRVVAVNLKGPFLVCRAVIPHMINAGRGAIVNIGSGAGWGKAGIAAYGASKGGVHALSSALAYDHLSDGIRVNVVIPGPQTASGMVEEMAAAQPLPGVATASGRKTEPQDVAGAVAYLLSDEAVQISGTIIDVGAFAHQGGVGQPRG